MYKLADLVNYILDTFSTCYQYNSLNGINSPAVTWSP